MAVLAEDPEARLIFLEADVERPVEVDKRGVALNPWVVVEMALDGHHVDRADGMSVADADNLVAQLAPPDEAAVAFGNQVDGFHGRVKVVLACEDKQDDERGGGDNPQYYA